MRRRALETVTLIIAVLVGYGIAVVVAPGVVAPSANPVPGPRTTTETTITATGPGSTTSLVSRPEIYLVWSTGGLTSDLTARLEDRFEQLSVVRGDVVEMDWEEGLVVPLDALAIEPDAHDFFDPRGSLSPLLPGTVALGETSAEFRRLTVGDDLSIGGTPHEIVAIVPDEVVGAAEVVFSKTDQSSSIGTDRFALVATDLDRNEFEDVVRDMYDGPAPLRIRTQDETPWLRHGDAVLPQIFIKTALGEFGYSERSGPAFTQDPGFVDDNIVEATVPLIGEVTCHFEVVDMLRGAMTQLVDEGLSHLVDRAGYAGCWNPRYIRSTTGTSAGISRHAWGAAVDINAASNPVGSAGTQDPRLVEVMHEWGFTWGGDWLVPDPMHFEYGKSP